VPRIPPPKPADQLPEPPPAEPPPGARLRPGSDPNAPLSLEEVLRSVDTAFPLLLAIEQERAIAAGQRLSAEGQFDPVLRANGIDQAGTFSSARLDTSIEQATPFGGITTFAGWRLGLGNFPVYNGGQKTADGGEFRTGVSIPWLQNRAIDPRRARLRAAQIAEQLADPVIRRARLDFFRLSAQAYWAWQAAGGQYLVARELLRLAQQRQDFLDEQRRQGLIGEAVPTLNRRLIASREVSLIAAERVLQQAALRLSLYLRDSAGNPVVPPPEWLLPAFADLRAMEPDPSRLAADVELALSQRPELLRFQLEKQRRTVELQLAVNQLSPIFNTFASINQDVGAAKKSFTGQGIFDTDRTTAQVGAVFEMPLPFRTARGLANTARAQLAQLLAQERFARDDITAQVQDAVSELVQSYRQVQTAREEYRYAARVVELETESFRQRLTSLVELNLQEVAAAEARAKLVGVLGAYFAAVANYLAVLGIDNPAADRGGAVLPQTQPTLPETVLPAPRPLPPADPPKGPPAGPDPVMPDKKPDQKPDKKPAPPP
jgi:outer membrane protein TolC